MIIDFKEIPKANVGGGQQDTFEQFACDLLEVIGFKIITRPDRGPDGKKDFIVSEARRGIEDETIVKWIVSCKHYAHSGKSVNDNDEPNILDRVHVHKCDGFLGFYSTIIAPTLNNNLIGLSDRVQYSIYDSAKIEKAILNSTQKDRILLSYFPTSYENYQNSTQTDLSDKQSEAQNKQLRLTEETILQICKRAIIILEVEKIKEEYFSNSWEIEQNPLQKLYRYSEHFDAKTANSILSFLTTVADQTSQRTHPQIASTLYSLVLTFFRISDQYTKKEINENAHLSAYMAFALTYEAFIRLNNFKIASYGLCILKFLYKEGKRTNSGKVLQEVMEVYEEIEFNLKRPGRDLEKAREFVKYFKDDLDSPTLMLPILPEDLFTLMESGDVK